MCLALLLGGCMVGPNYRAPETTTPEAWSGMRSGAASTRPSTTQPAATQPSVATTRPVPMTTWWQGLRDPMLDALIARAVESNLDLRIAEWRVREARAQRGIVFGNLWPQVNVGSGYNYSGSSLNSGPKPLNTSPGLGRQLLDSAATGALNGIGSALGPQQANVTPGVGPQLVTNALGQAVSSKLLQARGPAVSRQMNLFRAGFDASWEIDLFGGLRRAVEAADYTIAATEDTRRDALVTLLSEVAFNYVQLRAFQRRLDIARENIRAQADTLELTRSRYKAGLTSELDVAQAQAQLATTQSQVPLLESSIQQSIYQLSVLIAQPPGTLVEELGKETPLPMAPREVPIGLPSDLLRRRPDIRAAERQLAAATAQIGVATADMFPKFFLTGSFGPSARDIRHFLDQQSLTWSVGPNMQWAIFEGGKIVSNIQLQGALAEEALTFYERTVLTALQDVESALVAFADEQVRYRSLAEAVAANQRSFDLSYELYSRGLTAFLNVLTSENALYASQDALIQSQSTVLTNMIALYKALGGGWDADEDWESRLPAVRVGWPKVNLQFAPPGSGMPPPEP
jgi:multidrug efflux system outer membrane protein